MPKESWEPNHPSCKLLTAARLKGKNQAFHRTSKKDNVSAALVKNIISSTLVVLFLKRCHRLGATADDP